MIREGVQWTTRVNTVIKRGWGFLLSLLLVASQVAPGSVESLNSAYVSNRQTNAMYVRSVLNVWWKRASTAAVKAFAVWIPTARGIFESLANTMLVSRCYAQSIRANDGKKNSDIYTPNPSKVMVSCHHASRLILQKLSIWYSVVLFLWELTLI
jgi:hypothetical protein